MQFLLPKVVTSGKKPWHERNIVAQIASSIEMQLGENWRAMGTILSAVHYQGKLWLQVVMNKDVEQEANFRVNGIALQICELPYSLEE